MAVTDLTNTTWLINSEIDTYPSFNTDYYINFVSNNTDFTQLKLYYSDGKKNILYDYDSVLYGAMWIDENYKTIEITGGDDAENISLIAWLEANATQITVEDLTGTKWIINDTPDWFYSTSYEIDFVTNNETEEYNEIQSVIDHGTLIYYLPAQQPSAIWDTSNGWLDSAYKTIEITGGTDSTNINLIGWLTQNATQVIAPTKTYKLGWRVKQNSWPGTDLTNTTWIFNSGVYVTSAFNTIYINFNSYHNNYTSISFNNNMGTLKYNNTIVYDEENIGGWMLEDFQLITISGGTDATNSQFISWLQQNATLQSW